MNQHFLSRPQLPLIRDTWKMPYECEHSGARQLRESQLAMLHPDVAKLTHNEQTAIIAAVIVREREYAGRSVSSWREQRSNNGSAIRGEQTLARFGLSCDGKEQINATT